MLDTLSYSLILPVCMVMYGVGAFVSGSVLQFKPLTIGGIICWAAAFIAHHVDYEYQLLLMSFAVICSYIIPGYILKKNYKDESI